MSEIEKMYKNAGIPKYGKRQCKDSEYLECQNYCFCGADNKCNKFVIEYPPFTTEKQMLLLQWLLDRADLYLHRHKTDFTYSIASGDIAANKYSKSLEESIAEFINASWQSLTEEEKQHIKEILE